MKKITFGLVPTKIREEPWKLRLALGRAYYKENAVYVGTDIDYSNRNLWDGNYNPRFNKYDCVQKLYFDCTESIITHEAMHLVLAKIDGKETSSMWDNIDHELQTTEMN